MKIDHYYYSIQKRMFDLVISLGILCLLLPLFIVLYPILLLAIGSPLIFSQKRVGKNKKTFTIYKIRTMRNGSSFVQKRLTQLNEAPYPMFKIKEDPRFHKLGGFLSNSGIDEIPQILNIFKNEMSFVGPRPLPINESNILDSTWEFRYLVKPGILSKWALSSKRHVSLNEWRKLEKSDLKKASIISDINLITNAIRVLIVNKTFSYLKLPVSK